MSRKHNDDFNTVLNSLDHLDPLDDSQDGSAQADYAQRSVSDWQRELATDPIIFDLVYVVNGWGDETTMTRSEYESAISSLSFTLH